MGILKVEVTQVFLDKGVPTNIFVCPVALAIVRSLEKSKWGYSPDPTPEGLYDAVSVGVNSYSIRVQNVISIGKLPQFVVDNIGYLIRNKKFPDEFVEVKPFEFEIELENK